MMFSYSHWGMHDALPDTTAAAQHLLYAQDAIEYRATILTGPMPPLIPWWREPSYDSRYLHDHR